MVSLRGRFWDSAGRGKEGRGCCKAYLVYVRVCKLLQGHLGYNEGLPIGSKVVPSLGYLTRILNISRKKELLRGLWVELRGWKGFWVCRILGSSVEWAVGWERV